VQQAIAWIRESVAPLIVAGWRALTRNGATALLQQFVEQTGIPVGETLAGKGSLPYNHSLNLGAIGTTGTPGRNILAREADLIIGIGTRYSDFTSASNTAFQNPNVRFINLNVAEWDAYKRNALPLVGDAYATLQELLEGLNGYRTADDYQARCQHFNQQWMPKSNGFIHWVTRRSSVRVKSLARLTNSVRPEDVVLCAAGSLPGDLA
jgi:3D-(3,5/4)-trihydroxycyclohexane-1,2-dione acylhydrolase (decyclizing)